MIKDGMRTHDELGAPRYRMPDLLTEEEMVLYFASQYDKKVTLSEVDDELREKTQGVATLPYPSTPLVSDTVLQEHRKQLGLTELEEKSGVADLERAKALDARTLTKSEYDEKYGTSESSEELTPEEKLQNLL